MRFFKPILTVLVVALFLTASSHLFHLFMADYHIAQAKKLEKGRDWNTAIHAYRKAIDYAPGNPDYHFLLGRYYLRFGQAAKDKVIKGRFLRRARKELQEARKASPKDAQIYLAMAQTSEALSALMPKKTYAQESNEIVQSPSGSTESYYREAVSLYPSNTQYRYLLASYLKKAAKYDEALKQLQGMMALDPHTHDYLWRNPFWDIPDIDKAIDNGLQQALRNRHTRNVAASVLVSRLTKDQKWIEAAALYKEYAMPEVASADRSSYYLTLGQYLLRGGAEKEAEGYFLRAFGAASDRRRILKSIINTYQGVQKLNELFTLLEELKSRHPEVIEIDLYWVQLLYRQRRYQDAYAHLKDFLRTKENPEANYWMAMICKELERSYEAEAHIKRAIKWAPENALYRHFYAGLLYEAWRFSEALEQADAAVRASHQGKAAYLDRKAEILYKMKRYEESIRAWELAATLNPGDKGVQRNIEMAAKAASTRAK